MLSRRIVQTLQLSPPEDFRMDHILVSSVGIRRKHPSSVYPVQRMILIASNFSSSAVYTGTIVARRRIKAALWSSRLGVLYFRVRLQNVAAWSGWGTALWLDRLLGKVGKGPQSTLWLVLTDHNMVVNMACFGKEGWWRRCPFSGTDCSCIIATNTVIHSKNWLPKRICVHPTIWCFVVWVANRPRNWRILGVARRN